MCSMQPGLAAILLPAALWVISQHAQAAAQAPRSPLVFASETCAQPLIRSVRCWAAAARPAQAGAEEVGNGARAMGAIALHCHAHQLKRNADAVGGAAR